MAKGGSGCFDLLEHPANEAYKVSHDAKFAPGDTKVMGQEAPVVGLGFSSNERTGTAYNTFPACCEGYTGYDRPNGCPDGRRRPSDASPTTYIKARQLTYEGNFFDKHLGWLRRGLACT